MDEYDRRLFIGNEFDNTTGRLKADDSLNCTKRDMYVKNTIIIDSEVYDPNGTNHALPKSKFAQYIRDRHRNFHDFDFSNFELIFAVIEQIISDSHTAISNRGAP